MNSIKKLPASIYFCWGIVFSFLSISSSYGTHIMGGELTYTCLGNNQYELTLIIYRDCNGINLGSTQIINQIDDCGTSTNHSIPLISFQEITPVCPNIQGTACNGGGGVYGIEEFIYKTTLTLAPNCTNINFSWNLCCRNYAINTLSSPGSESMYIQTVIPDASICNSSPIFLNNPTPFACVGQLVNYNHGAVDSDNDDLVFSLVDCMDDAYNSVVYVAGLGALNPLSTSNGVSINPNTGGITFTPNQAQVGVICVLVEEYRNGIKISEIVRDIQFTILNCNNDSPTLTGIDSSNIFSTNLKVGNSLCFDVFSNDINTNQLVSIQWNQGIPTGTFTIDSSGQYPKGTFCWTSNINNIGNNIFTVVVFDDNCPLIGMNTYTFDISVSLDTITSIKDGSWSSPSTWDCNCIPQSLQNIIINHNVSLATNFITSDGTFLHINTIGQLTILDNYHLTIEGVLNNYNTIDGHLILGGSTPKYVRLGDIGQVEIVNSTSILAAADCNVNQKITLSSGSFNSNNYTVTLQSTSSGSALVEDNGGNFTGNLVVQRYLLNTIGHHFISSPFSDATLQELDDDFSLSLNSSYPHIYYYDETDTSIHSSDGWLVPSSLSHLMAQGEGYSCYFMAGSGITLDMAGSISTGPISIPLTHTINSFVDTSSCPPEGWNLIGNPYPSPLDFDLVMQSAPPEVEKALYAWDPTTKSYLSYVDGIGSPSSFRAIIPSMQGFWVKANSNTTLSFDNTMRITNPEDTVNTFYKSQTPSSPLFRLTMEGQGQTTELVTRFKANATTGFDSDFDAFFIASEYPGSVDFAASTSNGPLTINTLPPLQTMPVLIPLYNKVTNAGTYTIALTGFSNFGSNDQVILEDVALGINQILNNGSYTFSTSTTDSPRRFNLQVIPAIISTLDKIEEGNLFNVFRCQEMLCLSFQEALTETTFLKIYNNSGQLLHTNILEKGAKEYQLNRINLPSSNVYFITLESSLQYKSKVINW
jgi:hypothetical protein